MITKPIPVKGKKVSSTIMINIKDIGDKEIKDKELRDIWWEAMESKIHME